MLVALLDTSVLWPSLQRDFLLSLHIQGVYRALWSAAILDELEFHEARKLHKFGVDASEATRRAHALITQMRGAFSDSIVSGWEELDGTFGLPDVDDEHVVAAAVVAQADLIVTENLRHFPADRIPDRIEVAGVAEFAYRTVSRRPSRAVAAVNEIVARSGRLGPVLTRDQVFEVLEVRYSMTEAVAVMQRFRNG